MPSLRNLPAVQINGAHALANRPRLDPREALRRAMGRAVESGLQSEDQTLLRSLGVTRDGVIGAAHRGLIVHWIKDWGTTNGDEILINADLDDVIGQVPFVRNRIPDISLKHLRLQAQALIAGPADPQMGG
jgi:hypothetical protein